MAAAFPAIGYGASHLDSGWWLRRFPAPRSPVVVRLGRVTASAGGMGSFRYPPIYALGGRLRRKRASWRPFDSHPLTHLTKSIDTAIGWPTATSEQGNPT